MANLAHSSIYLTIFAALFAGCGLPPSKNVEYRHVFDYAKDRLKEIEEANYANQAQGKAMALYRKVPYILYAKRGQSIKFVQQAVEPRADSLIYSLGNGRYRLKRNLYMVMLGRNSLLSFDRKQWFIPVAASPAEGSNLEFRLKFDLVAEDSQHLVVDYRAELVLAEKLSYKIQHSQTLSQRPVRRGRAGDHILLQGRQISKSSGLVLETGQQVYDELTTNISGNALKLQELAIFYPKGFEFYYRLSLLGNLLQALTVGPTTEVTFQRDVYFYYPHSLLRPSVLTVIIGAKLTSISVWNHLVAQYLSIA